MYILLDEHLRVQEFIKEEDEIFPGIPLSERYSKEFLDSLVYVDDGIYLEEGYAFNEETQSWEYLDPPFEEYIGEENSLNTRIEELESENKLLKSQVQVLSDQMDFYEECIVEMAEVVYA